MVATQQQPELDTYLENFCTTVKEFEKYVSIYQENMNKDSFESEENIYSYLRGVESKLTSLCDNYPGTELITELIEERLSWHQKLFRKMQLNFFEALIQLAHQDKSIVSDLYEVVNFSEWKIFTYGPIMYLMSKILGYGNQPICQKISAIFCLVCEGKATAVSGDLNLYLWPTEGLSS